MLAERRVMARELRFFELAANLHCLGRHHHQQQQQQQASTLPLLHLLASALLLVKENLPYDSLCVLVSFFTGVASMLLFVFEVWNWRGLCIYIHVAHVPQDLRTARVQCHDAE
jgi:hypothetical protein